MYTVRACFATLINDFQQNSQIMSSTIHQSRISLRYT